MIAYKFLKLGAVGLVSGFRWPTPTGDSPGAWVEAEVPLRECESGIHVCRAGDLPYWMYDELWAIEIDGETVEGINMLVAPRGRLLYPLTGWTWQGRTTFVEACRDRASSLVREAPAERRKHADALLGHMDNYLRLELTQLGALCAALAVASLADAGSDTTATKASYHAERVWQSQWLVANLGLVVPRS
jgi:hypothetical protein